MKEREIIERLGPPDKIVTDNGRLRGRMWMCSTCGEMLRSPERIPVPAPCKHCGAIAFESDDAE